MPMLECIRTNFSEAVVPRCSDMGCTLELDGLPNSVVLKGEKIATDRKICDCLVFAVRNRVLIGVVELKSKTVHADEVVEKLTNGTETALQVLDRCGNDRMKPQVYNLVLAKRWDGSEYRVLTNRKVMVRGRKYLILPKRCGVSFSGIISSLA